MTESPKGPTSLYGWLWNLECLRPTPANARRGWRLNARLSTPAVQGATWGVEHLEEAVNEPTPRTCRENAAQ